MIIIISCVPNCTIYDMHGVIHRFITGLGSVQRLVTCRRSSDSRLLLHTQHRIYLIMIIAANITVTMMKIHVQCVEVKIPHPSV